MHLGVLKREPGAELSQALPLRLQRTLGRVLGEGCKPNLVSDIRTYLAETGDTTEWKNRISLIEYHVASLCGEDTERCRRVLFGLWSVIPPSTYLSSL